MNGVIGVPEIRPEALARLDVLAGDWTLAARFPGAAGGGPGVGRPAGRSQFEWALGGQFLLQHTEAPVPAAPDSLAIISVDPGTGRYTQHYYDSRGVVRLYAMDLADGTWTLTRDSADFSPLDFAQRFTGTFSPDESTITGAWEKRFAGGDWEHDFALTYRRAG
jgi:hypothetical protein